MRDLGTRWSAIVVFASLFSLPLLQAQTPNISQKAPSQSTSAKHRTTGRQQRAIPPTISLSQMPLNKPLHWVEFTPSGPLTIHYTDGKLTINAVNSPLHDVLQGVGKRFGASVELPPGVNDHVFGQIGPGRASDVVASLLSGVNFNYVISVSAEDPNQLTRVVLSPKPAPLPAGNRKAKQ